ncbi:MAG: hypothetical protein Q8O40_13370 [Chloroflexota bacterium]|nr:hypothetical protein [Chloroflexota bacterium]
MQCLNLHERTTVVNADGLAATCCQRLRDRPTGQQTRSKAGEKVVHAKFGQGTVANCVPSGTDLEVTVAFKGEAGVKRLLASFAPLPKVE